MKKKYEHIFSPLTVKRMTMKNRIVMMPMGTNFGEQNGEMSFLHINYYEQRAKGGTGLIIVENASVDSPQGSNGTTQIRIDKDSYIPRLFMLCEAVHKHGACIALQINHAGASAMSSRIGMQPVSASNIPSKAGGEIPRPLEKEEIEYIAKKYGEAAKRVQTAGFDAVEIHAGHSYLISQFLSPLTNDRTDEFGGSPENRARFARMIIDEVRKQVGPMFPIILRISADELMEGGNTLDDCLEYLEYLQDEVDIFDVSAGLNGSIQYQIDANYLPDGWRSYMAKAVKERYNKPCISMGNYRNPQVVEDVLAKGDADLIGSGSFHAGANGVGAAVMGLNGINIEEIDGQEAATDINGKDHFILNAQFVNGFAQSFQNDAVTAAGAEFMGFGFFTPAFGHHRRNIGNFNSHFGPSLFHHGFHLLDQLIGADAFAGFEVFRHGNIHTVETVGHHAFHLTEGAFHNENVFLPFHGGGQLLGGERS